MLGSGGVHRRMAPLRLLHQRQDQVVKVKRSVRSLQEVQEVCQTLRHSLRELELARGIPSPATPVKRGSLFHLQCANLALPVPTPCSLCWHLRQRCRQDNTVNHLVIPLAMKRNLSESHLSRLQLPPKCLLSLFRSSQRTHKLDHHPLGQRCMSTSHRHLHTAAPMKSACCRRAPLRPQSKPCLLRPWPQQLTTGLDPVQPP